MAPSKTPATTYSNSGNIVCPEILWTMKFTWKNIFKNNNLSFYSFYFHRIQIFKTFHHLVEMDLDRVRCQINREHQHICSLEAHQDTILEINPHLFNNKVRCTAIQVSVSRLKYRKFHWIYRISIIRIKILLHGLYTILLKY